MLRQNHTTTQPAHLPQPTLCAFTQLAEPEPNLTNGLDHLDGIAPPTVWLLARHLPLASLIWTNKTSKNVTSICISATQPIVVLSHPSGSDTHRVEN